MNNIDNLLNSYFDGEISPKDEIVLKTYFRGNAVLPQHEAYKPLFDTFEKEKTITAPPFLIPEKKKAAVPRHLWTLASSIAAAVLLALILFPFNRKTANHSQYVVYLNGNKITNEQRAKNYADEMFAKVDKMIEETYAPFTQAKITKQEMDADLLFEEAYRNINN